jgi:hypothetical protein
MAESPGTLTASALPPAPGKQYMSSSELKLVPCLSTGTGLLTSRAGPPGPGSALAVESVDDDTVVTEISFSASGPRYGLDLAACSRTVIQDYKKLFN